MRALLLCGLLLFGCDDVPIDHADLGGGESGGCGVVDFCLDFLGGDGSSFAQCVLPFPKSDDTPAANAYFSCVETQGLKGGACEVSCAGEKNDLGVRTIAGCETCLHSTGCPSEARACGF